MKRKWISEHELPEELFDLFDSANGTRLPDNSIYRLAIPLSCRSNRFRGSVNLKYQIPLGTQNAKIFVAIPFNVFKNFTRPGNETTTCVMTYHGPKYILSTPECLHVLNDDRNIVARKSYIFTEGTVCVNKTFGSNQSFWTKLEETCRPASLMTFSMSQSVMTPMGATIYCFGQRIRMQETELDCPNYVFHLPVTQSFSFGPNFIYSGELKNFYERPFSIIDHLRISTQVQVDIKDDPLMSSLHHLEEVKIVPIIPLKPFYEYHSFYYLAALILLLAVCFACYHCYQFHRRIGLQFCCAFFQSHTMPTEGPNIELGPHKINHRSSIILSDIFVIQAL